MTCTESDFSFSFFETRNQVTLKQPGYHRYCRILRFCCSQIKGEALQNLCRHRGIVPSDT